MSNIQTDDLISTNVHNLKPSNPISKVKGSRQCIQWLPEMQNAWNAFRRPDGPPNKLTAEAKLSLDPMIVLL